MGSSVSRSVIREYAEQLRQANDIKEGPQYDGQIRNYNWRMHNIQRLNELLPGRADHDPERPGFEPDEENTRYSPPVRFVNEESSMSKIVIDATIVFNDDVDRWNNRFECKIVATPLFDNQGFKLTLTAKEGPQPPEGYIDELLNNYLYPTLGNDVEFYYSGEDAIQDYPPEDWPPQDG